MIFSVENYKRDDGCVCWIRTPCVSKIISLLVTLWNSSLTKTDLTITDFLYISARTTEISPYCANTTSETDPRLLFFFIQRMPLKFGGGPKCKRCGKTVYKAEEVISEAGIFHKQCFRCSSCNKVPGEQIVVRQHHFIYLYLNFIYLIFLIQNSLIIKS